MDYILTVREYTCHRYHPAESLQFPGVDLAITSHGDVDYLLQVRLSSVKIMRVYKLLCSTIGGQTTYN